MSTLNRFKTLKVYIAVPSLHFWFTDFAKCFCNLLTYTSQHRHPEYRDVQVTTQVLQGSMLVKLRLDAVKVALEAGATHLLWLDSDHIYPPALLYRLLSHKLDVVGVNHVSKTIPAGPTARGWPTKECPGGVPVFTELRPKVELEKVWRLGCGTMLITRKVMEQIGNHGFDMVYDERIGGVRGEDWSMCERIESGGFDIWIDHPLSNMCGHIGTYVYTHDVVGQVVREETPAKEEKRIVTVN